MPYKNKIVILGHLGKDAEHRMANNSDTEVTKFSVATSHGTKDNKQTVWHSVVAFNLPDWIKHALVKGVTVLVEGRQENNSYEKDGKKYYYNQIIADNYNGVIVFGNNTEQQEQQESPDNQDDQQDDLPF